MLDYTASKCGMSGDLVMCGLFRNELHLMLDTEQNHDRPRSL